MSVTGGDSGAARKGQSAVQRPRSFQDQAGPIRTRRVFEEICERIRNQLISGELKPGDRLPPERELAELYVVSRTALREALLILEIIGLLELRKGRSGGAFITERGAGLFTRSFRDLLDFGQASLAMLLDARAVIQIAVVQVACAVGTEADFDRLQQNIDETQALTDQGRFVQRTFKAMEFNNILGQATGNAVLATVVEAMGSVLRDFIASAGPQPHDPVIAARRELLARLRARDPDGAARSLRRYFEGLRAHLLDGKAKRIGPKPRRTVRAAQATTSAAKSGPSR